MPQITLANEWISVPRPSISPRVRLLCFPHGGGSAHAFYAWLGHLPADVEICAVQLPGRGRRLLEAPLTGIDQVMAPLWEAFLPFRDAPVAFFGHSLGALIAFEFARRIRSEDVSLVQLFVSGAAAPQLPDREPPIRHLPDRAFLTEVRQRYDALPLEIMRDDQMVEVLLPALRADFAMAETYRHVGGPLLACPVSALGGQQDSSVSVYELAAWRTQTTGVFGFRLFPGGHFFVDSSRDAVLRYVTEDLERSLRGFVPRGREEEATNGPVAHAGPAPARGVAGKREG